MVEDFGIVLRSFLPYKNKISVLTQRFGKSNLIVRPATGRFNRRRNGSNLSAGIAIKFFTKPGSTTLVSRFEVLIVPSMPLGPHLYWFHHLLEICYYFIPVGDISVDVFKLLRYALELSEKSYVFDPYFHVVRKVFLLKILILLGFYPSRSAAPNDLIEVSYLFKDVVLVILDSSNIQKVRSLHVLLGNVSKQTIKEIDKWVLGCLYEHPHVEYFKTLSFFNDM